MDLLVDIGNSRIKWSTPDELQHGRSRVGVCQDLPRILQKQWRDMQRPDRVWISSVANLDVTEQLCVWLRQIWKLSPVLVRSLPAQLGVINGYKNPAQLGVDRWMAMLGARAITTAASLVVDCGTATTIDSLDEQGHHLGGMILPGMQAMQETLLRDTAIQTSGSSLEYSSFSRDTASAIASAAVLATCCLIKQTAIQLQDRVKSEVCCILTGGAAAELNGSLELEVHHEPHLVLNGLALVAAQSTYP